MLAAGTKPALTEKEQQIVDKLIKDNLCMSFVPNGGQERFIKLVGEGGFLVYVFNGGNGSGKTTLILNILINLLYKEPVNEYFNTPFFKNFKHPISARIISNATAIEKKIIPEFKMWLPKGTYKTKKGRKTFDALWDFQDGSDLDIMTNDQDIKEFESVEKDVIIVDEPITREIFTASISRLRKGGLLIIGWTPLADADWAVERMEEGLWGVINADCEENCIQHGKNGVLEHENIERILNEYDPEERDARKKGIPLMLSGKVFKNFDASVHCVPKRDIDPEWVLGLTIDPHPSRPWFLAWWALTKKNELIFIEEYPREDFDKLKYVAWSTEDYYNVIKEVEADFPTKVEYRLIDPNSGRTPDFASGKTIPVQFEDIEISRGITEPEQMMYFDSEINDDIDAGVLAVKQRLYYDKTKPLSGSNQPSLFIFDTLYNLKKHITKWRHNEWKHSKGKSASERYEAKNKDGSDCVRYTVMKNPIFEMPKSVSYNKYDRVGKW